MTRILIIGGAGFVGSHLTQLLINANHNVHILDNGLSGALPKDILCFPRDVRDEASMKSLIPQYDIIVHLAGIVGVPACTVNEQFAFDVNVKGTENIVRHLRKDARIIFTSSTSAYGNKVNQLVTEETTLTPLTNYGLHKLYNETEIKRHTDNYIIVRPATAFGLSTRTRMDVLPNTLIFDALTKPRIEIFEPEVIRPFIHVHDFARILQYAVENRMPWGHVYNIGDSRLTMTKGQLARRIGELSGTEIIIRDGTDPDKRNYSVSFQKLYNTGFGFQHDMLEFGFNQIKEQIEIIKNNYGAYNTPYHVQEYLRKYGPE